MDLLITGRPNVGKTLLMINFVGYLGLREIRAEVLESDGVRRTMRLSLDRARRDLVSLSAPKTTHLQAVTVELPVGRQRTRLVLLDTPGISGQISSTSAERRQTATTLERLMTATLIFHVVDASVVRYGRIPDFDAALAEYGRRHRHRYVMVANKMDRPGSHEGLKELKDHYKALTLVPVSSLTRRGFRDLRLWVVRTLV